MPGGKGKLESESGVSGCPVGLNTLQEISE